MSGTVVEVHWFPRYTDKFVTSGSEINLYEVKNQSNKNEWKDVNLDISNITTACLLASETRYQYIRCVSPSFCENQLLAAVGLANGKVALCNFVASTENNIEYTPRQSRPCLTLAWNELETNLLAMGHDRNRSDHCITIWDTERGAPKESSILHLIGLSETAHSLCWDKQNRVLLAGMSHKYIKMIDLRQSSPVLTVSNTRAVHGLSISSNGRYFASYIDNIVGLWDIRNIDKPINQLSMQKNVTALFWCPTRSNVLSTLQRDSTFVHLLDLHWPGLEMEDTPHSMKRNVAPFLSGANTRHISIGDISWHPTDVERLLALSGSGTICDYKIPQRIAVFWDHGNTLWGSTGNEIHRLGASSPTSSLTDFLNISVIEQPTEENASGGGMEDIAELIQKRALNDYGQMADIQLNGELAQNPSLRSVWRLLAHMNREDCMLGLKAILGVSSSNDGPPMSRSDMLNITWTDFPGGSVKVYRSEQREFAKLLCGWNFNNFKENAFNGFIDELCAKQEYTRAAMLACFHLKVRYAIEILGKGAERIKDDSSTMRMAAIALAGFNLDKTGVWRTQCNAARAQINDPHLRTMFGFLTLNDSYEIVLEENDVSLCDRMAFACMLLSDCKLSDYVKAMIQKCTEKGDLNGLLLTGATNDGINLLQSHLDWTEDVQTVALIAARFLTQDHLSDYRVQYWISSYRDLLDLWGLWEHRAQLDITMGNSRSPRATRSVFLLCSFCGKSVSACLQEDSRIRSNTTNINKLSCCPHCRKPLPRCSLCLLHMGTTTGFLSQKQNHNGLGAWQTRPFDKWFSWCQSCRHGGHTKHLSEWFLEHSECPVYTCTCKCFAMDL